MIIESPNLVLRALTRDEAEAIVTEDRTDRSWAPDYPSPPDVGIAAIALAGRAAFPSNEVPWGLFVIEEKSSGLSVGGIGFKGAPTARGEVEIGYGVSPSRRGHGVASEAVRTLCDFARGRVSAVVAETEPANVASQRVLEKCGFLRDGGGETIIRWRRDLAE